MTSSAKPGKRSPGITRPIKTKRDFERALTVTQRLLAQPNRETAAELRLQALLKEMDRFEEVDHVDEGAGDDFADDSLHGGSRRRWSDEGADD
jgi:hypothetical protein